jgi:hypothetical protein
MKKNQDLTYLYQKYYQDSYRDLNTSSHWEKYGEKIKVSDPTGIKSLSEIKLFGNGFGDYKKINFINLCGFIFLIPYYFLMILRSKNLRFLKQFMSTLKKSGFIPTFDSVKNYLVINEINEHLNLSKIKTVAIIGDGYGFLGNLIKNIYPKINIVQINLGKVLFFDLVYTLKNFPNANYFLLKDFVDSEILGSIYPLNSKSSEKNNKRGGFIFVEAEKFDQIKELLPKIEIFINVASFQEMDYSIIYNYFDFMRSNQNCYLYTCNRESKILPNNSLIEFSRYGWLSNDIFLMNEECSWYRRFPSLRPPFIHKFDGKMRQALVKLSNV